MEFQSRQTYHNNEQYDFNNNGYSVKRLPTSNICKETSEVKDLEIPTPRFWMEKGKQKRSKKKPRRE